MLLCHLLVVLKALNRVLVRFDFQVEKKKKITADEPTQISTFN